MLWLLGTGFIIILALVIIKLVVNTNDNPDSSLGILEHPSTFKMQKIEHVDEVNQSKSEHNLEL
ncbi:hypothetical protein [Winogradskyella poriferorum]|uniref:hypothetical protein n=1 Tax=Winogradskyella poriferorum TaxID=307627 RepID=UPI003D6479DB